MKKFTCTLFLVVVFTLVMGTMATMAINYSTDEYTPRTITVDTGAIYRQVGYDIGSIAPFDDAKCWAKGSGPDAYSRDLYAKTAQGEAKSYKDPCNGYSNKVTVESKSSGIDHDEGKCYSVIGGVGDSLTIN